MSLTPLKNAHKSLSSPHNAAIVNNIPRNKIKIKVFGSLPLIQVGILDMRAELSFWTLAFFLEVKITWLSHFMKSVFKPEI